MVTSRLLNNYAKALLQQAAAQQVTHSILQSCKQLLAFAKEPALQQLLRHPQVSSTTKITTLRRLAPDNAPALFCRFLELVLNNQQTNLLFDILQQVLWVNEQTHHQITAHITTATALPKKLHDLIQKHLQQLNHGHPIHLAEQVDPNLLGGYRLQIGDRLLDASITTQLKQLHRQLVTH